MNSGRVQQERAAVDTNEQVTPVYEVRVRVLDAVNALSDPNISYMNSRSQLLSVTYSVGLNVVEGVDAQVRVEAVISEQPHGTSGFALLQDDVESSGVAVHGQSEVLPLTRINAHGDNLV